MDASCIEAKKVDKEFILWDKYTLNQLSGDIEIDNPRTDFRHLRNFVTPKSQISQRKIPDPVKLSQGQLIYIFDQILIREFAWLQGWPIPYCFYDLA